MVHSHHVIIEAEASILELGHQQGRKADCLIDDTSSAGFSLNSFMPTLVHCRRLKDHDMCHTMRLHQATSLPTQVQKNHTADSATVALEDVEGLAQVSREDLVPLNVPCNTSRARDNSSIDASITSWPRLPCVTNGVQYSFMLQIHQQ